MGRFRFIMNIRGGGIKMDMRNWEVFDTLLATLGGEKLAEEIIRYMSSDMANRYMESIAREYEIADEEEEG